MCVCVCVCVCVFVCVFYAYMSVCSGRASTLDVFLSFQPVLHNWFNKGRGVYYPVCGMVHIKDPLLLIGTSYT